MRRLLCILLLTALNGLGAFSQLDSLIVELERAKHDTLKAKLLVQISEVCPIDDIPGYQRQLMDVCDRNLKSGSANNQFFQKMEAEAVSNMGLFFLRTNDLDSAVIMYEESLGKFKSIKDAYSVAAVHLNLAHIFKFQGQIQKAIDYNHLTLDYCDSTGDHGLESVCLNNLGLIYEQQRLFDQAREYYQRIIELSEGAGDCVGIILANCRLGFLWYMEDVMPSARHHFIKALDASSSCDYIDAKWAANYHLARYYRHADSSKFGLPYIHKCLDMATNRADEIRLGATYLELARAQLGLLNLDSAIYYARPAIRMAQELQSYEEIHNTEEVLYEIFMAMEMYDSALVHYQLFIAARDSAINEDAKVTAVQQKAQRDYTRRHLTDSLKNKSIQEQKDREIRSRETEVSHERELRNAILIIALFSLLSGILLFNRYALRVKHRRNQAQIQNLETERKLLRAQMSPHFIFNSINSIQSYILDGDAQVARNYLVKFSRLVRSILEQTSQSEITVDEEVETLNLYLELEQLRFPNKFDYEVSVSPQISLDDDTVPPLIVQPFVENAVLHGVRHLESRGRIHVKFERTSPETLMCTVEDNGVGRGKSVEINAQRDTKHKSIATGLATSRIQRLKPKNGTEPISFEDLHDAEGNPSGTRVHITIPSIKVD